MIDIRDNPKICEQINEVINKRGGIAEVKVESKGITVVEISRILKK